ncbi:MAG TPA: sodium:calcium antiporter [Chitinophagales bacterium]|nr:sodium:calcium antiporter [Chitinophagales bacterium]
MILNVLIFISAIAALLVSARLFTQAAEEIGKYLRLPSFVIGVFIVGIGTSLPELISGTLSVQKGLSDILAGNVIGSNISNILLITGLAVAINRKSITLNTGYLFIDLHFLIGSFFYFYIIAYDGRIDFYEAFIGLIMFVVYSVHLIKGESSKGEETEERGAFPVKGMALLLLSGVGIYFGADYTVFSLEKIATQMGIPNSVIALTLLSLGTTLPELAVNISAIRQGKAEMAIGNVLGSCIFNTLVIPAAGAAIGTITVPQNLLGFSLPVMAGCGLFFYLLTHDKKISVWEGLMFVCLYTLFIIKIAMAT